MASAPVVEFEYQCVDLKQTVKSTFGHCPFHEDEHPSFIVKTKENYWYCFAGCGGGSLIDFWSKMREKQGLDPEFVATVAELTEMLL